jgi:hypothetical protein
MYHFFLILILILLDFVDWIHMLQKTEVKSPQNENEEPHERDPTTTLIRDALEVGVVVVVVVSADSEQKLMTMQTVHQWVDSQCQMKILQ